jgi:hypothetical protein
MQKPLLKGGTFQGNKVDESSYRPHYNRESAQLDEELLPSWLWLLRQKPQGNAKQDKDYAGIGGRY